MTVNKREDYRSLADAERVAAQRATIPDVFRAHWDKAREYDWLAVTEPMPDGDESDGTQG